MRTLPNRKANRLRYFDYSYDGVYFITICTKNRENRFGEIQFEKMQLNQCGNIADQFWREIPKHFHDIKIDSFVVMPNHVHGLIAIKKTKGFEYKYPLFPRNHEYLCRVMQQYKAAVTRQVNKIEECVFSWQRSFWDRYVRDEDELERARHYIWSNPKNWSQDSDNPINQI